MKLWRLALIFVLSQKPSYSEGSTLSDVKTTGVNITEKLVDNLPHFAPTSRKSDRVVKRIVPGLSNIIIAESVDEKCTLTLDEDAVHPRIKVNASDLNVLLCIPCKNVSIPLLKIENLLNYPEFDVDRKTVVLVSGWRTTIEDSLQDTILAKAYLCRDDINLLILDTAAYLKTNYTSAALNTQDIGEYLGEALTRINKTVPAKNIHIIGHSLGAHISGLAGAHYTKLTNQKLLRITGLDPAKPCFPYGESLHVLFRGDAVFVDVIHTTPGILGELLPMGDADFYPGGIDPHTLGCLDFLCAHNRSVSFYAESTYPGNERNFLAKPCNSLTNIYNGRCQGSEVPMGYAVPHDIEGVYFLDVNKHEPYGKNSTSNSVSADGTCGLCNDGINNS